MFVCVCKKVTDKQIKMAFKNGAYSVEKLKSLLNLGAGCGQCVEYTKILLETYKAEEVSKLRAKKLPPELRIIR
tara:strand:- start:3473 stop:3694 length:222 start_codon:yes stop_codon:yes gene_type:complete